MNNADHVKETESRERRGGKRERGERDGESRERRRRGDRERDERDRESRERRRRGHRERDERDGESRKRGAHVSVRVCLASKP